MVIILTNKTLITTSAANIFKYFYFYVLKKINLDISCESHEMSRFILSDKNRKSYSTNFAWCFKGSRCCQHGSLMLAIFMMDLSI